MIDARFVPIKNWPGKKKTLRKRAIFRVKYPARLDLLESELHKIGSTHILIQAYFDIQDIRNDGWPRSSARPKEPGVIVSFKKRTGELLSFPCDTYDAWEDNLYAIALSLEALRTVDRYGVTKGTEQYQGFKQLEAPAVENVRDEFWALEHLARIAQTQSSSLKGNRGAIDEAYRMASRKTHPDHGGSVEAFQVVQEAGRILRGSNVQVSG